MGSTAGARPRASSSPRTDAFAHQPEKQHVDVLLVSMPFGPQVLQPSLGLSLLAASLAPTGISTRVRYFTLDFAAEIGVPLYGEVAYTEPTIHGFAGDWVWSACLFDQVEHDVEGYVEDILRGKSAEFREARDNLTQVSEEVIEQILEIRAKAPAFLDRCLAEVLAARPRIVGFTSTFQQQVAGLALARRIAREAPGTFIVFGGANCEGVMGVEVLRQFPFVDAVVSGEADEIFPPLVARVLAGRPHEDIPGVNTRANSGFSPVDGSAFYSSAPMVRDLDSLPYPDFADFFKQYALADLGPEKATYRPRLMFETSRGCWWGQRSHCVFCGLNGSTLQFRAKSEERALAELLSLHEMYPGCPVSVTDNILDMKYFRGFLPELAAREMDLDLFYEVKANLRKQQVKLLAAAGIRAIQPGIESFSDQVLGLMRKGVRTLQNIQLLKWCKEYGVSPRWNMLWGFPGESPEEYRRVAELLPALHHLPPAGGGGIVRLDRFSPNFNRAEELGFTDLAPYPAYDYIYPLPPEAVAHLAYFFTYHYRQPRDVRGYTGAVRKALAAWQDAWRVSDLFYADKGEQLLIWDLRQVASQPLTLLTGALRDLYILCDGIATADQLARALNETLASRVDASRVDASRVDASKVAEMLRPLVERKLMVQDGSSYLSLALPLGEYSPSAEVLERFQALLRSLGEVSQNEITIPLPTSLGEEVMPSPAWT